MSQRKTRILERRQNVIVICAAQLPCKVTPLKTSTCKNRATPNLQIPGSKLSFVNDIYQGKNANAVSHYHSHASEVSHIWGKSRGRHRQSATEKPRPGKNALVITVISLPGKCLFFLFNAMLFWLKCSLIRVDVSCYIKGIDNNAIEQWNREASIWCPCSDLNLGLDQNIHYSQCKF